MSAGRVGRVYNRDWNLITHAALGSGVEFDREGVAVRILEPSYTPAAGPGGDPIGVMIQSVVANELHTAALCRGSSL